MARILVSMLAVVLLAACNREAPPLALPAPPVPVVKSHSHVAAAPLAADGTTEIVVTAPREHALFVGHCNGAFSWGLEHEEGDAWKPAWIPAINGCASAPFEIAPGQSRAFPVTFALAPGELLPAGRYRIALYALQRTRGGPGEVPEPVPADERASEPFDFDPALVPLPTP